MAPRRRKGQAEIEKLNARLERLQIEYVPASAITANDYNPNRQGEHEFGLLKASILEDGFTDPIKVVERDGLLVIVDGEHRWRAVRSLFEDGKLPDDVLAIVRLPMGEAQAKIATLRHNRARGVGGHRAGDRRAPRPRFAGRARLGGGLTSALGR